MSKERAIDSISSTIRSHRKQEVEQKEQDKTLKEKRAKLCGQINTLLGVYGDEEASAHRGMLSSGSRETPPVMLGSENGPIEVVLSDRVERREHRYDERDGYSVSVDIDGETSRFMLKDHASKNWVGEQASIEDLDQLSELVMGVAAHFVVNEYYNEESKPKVARYDYDELVKSVKDYALRKSIPPPRW